MKRKIFILFFFIMPIFLISQEKLLETNQQNKLDEKTLYKELIKSCQNGDLKKLIYLIEEYNPDLEKKDLRGNSPLLVASYSGNIDIVKYLLTKKININITDKNGNTSLLNSITRGHVEISNILLDNNANFRIGNKKEITPLLLASGNGYLEILKKIKFKAEDLNHQDTNGNTSLHYSIIGGHEDITEFLMQNGANFRIQNYQEKTPLTIASESGIIELIDTIKKNNINHYPIKIKNIGTIINEKNTDDLCTIKPVSKILRELKSNQVVYIFDTSEQEVGYGKLYSINPKFIRLKVERGSNLENKMVGMYY